MTAKKEYSAPSVHIWDEPGPCCQTWVHQYSACSLNVFSMFPFIFPPQCKVGALFKPLLPLPQMQDKDLLNSVEPSSMLQPQATSPAKSQPLTRPSSNSLNNGGTL